MCVAVSVSERASEFPACYRKSLGKFPNGPEIFQVPQSKDFPPYGKTSHSVFSLLPLRSF